MSKKYRTLVRNLKALQILLVLLCVLAFAGYGYFLFRPDITSYAIKDECGPIGGRISHSIEDVDVCNNACNAYCTSKDKGLDSSEFKEYTTKCNSCTCFCSE